MTCCNGDMMGGMWFAGLFWLLVIAAGIALVAWILVRAIRSGGPTDSGQEDRSLTILRERFARGEISESDYHEQRRILEEE